MESKEKWFGLRGCFRFPEGLGRAIPRRALGLASAEASLELQRETEISWGGDG